MRILLVFLFTLSMYFSSPTFALAMDGDDIQDFVNCFYGNDYQERFDFNLDGDIDDEDLIIFVNALLTR